MLARVMSFGLYGVEGYPVCVEVDMVPGMPSLEIVGLPDAAVKESRERVRAAIVNSGLLYPQGKRITVNLAPADTKKEGPVYDLPIAIGLLCADEKIPRTALEDTLFLGELSLDGGIRPVKGVLPAIIAAREKGYARLVIPKENAGEGVCVQGIELFPASSLRELMAHLLGNARISPQEAMPFEALRAQVETSYDLSQVRGQEGAKRALEIAAAGGHNLLMVGPPGSGKTMLARCLPGILPDMTLDESLEVTKIHSVAGNTVGKGLLLERPFRAPHHTASSVAMVGGGRTALPGEISKAHHGVLFLDELPEYQRIVLEALRQPLEDGFVCVSRIGAQVTYPSRFMLACSMNPCPCGHFGSRSGRCRCSPREIRKYLGRISGPLLDRIDLHIEVDAVPISEITRESTRPLEDSLSVRKRVNLARSRQHERYEGKLFSNAQLDAKEITVHCRLREDAQKLLTTAAQKLNFSARGYSRVLKVARTIADLEDAKDISTQHVAEAIQYRSLDTKYWGV